MATCGYTGHNVATLDYIWSHKWQKLTRLITTINIICCQTGHNLSSVAKWLGSQVVDSVRPNVISAEPKQPKMAETEHSVFRPKNADSAESAYLGQNCKIFGVCQKLRPNFQFRPKLEKLFRSYTAWRSTLTSMLTLTNMEWMEFFIAFPWENKMYKCLRHHYKTDAGSCWLSATEPFTIYCSVQVLLYSSEYI